jgi:hypothetical protein
MEAADQALAAGRLPVAGVQLPSLQRRSPYVNRSKGPGEGVELLPGEGKYLFVYPFTKTRSWYRLSPHARQGMMDEHIAASTPFKGVRLNTSYSYGIDDQDFVVAFDSDYPQEFRRSGGAAALYGGEPLYSSGTRRCLRARRRPLTRSLRSWRTWTSIAASEASVSASRAQGSASRSWRRRRIGYAVRYALEGYTRTIFDRD